MCNLLLFSVDALTSLVEVVETPNVEHMLSATPLSNESLNQSCDDRLAESEQQSHIGIMHFQDS